MSQIIITDKPKFENLIVLADMLPKSDRIALKPYLQRIDDQEQEQRFDEILARFRCHDYNEKEIKDDLERIIIEVRSSNKDKD